MRHAVDYIKSRLGEPIDMDEVARRAHSSPFHFQRTFHMLTGVTVAEYVRNRRLTLAAQELAASSARVVDVALRWGYESPEAFAKAFRRARGVTPSAARRLGTPLRAFGPISFQLSLRGVTDVEYRIVTRDAFRVVGLTLHTSLRDGENLRRVPEFCTACYADGTVDRLRAMRVDRTLTGVCQDDHAREEMTYAIAVEPDRSPAADARLQPIEIPAATWAVFTSTGALPEAVHTV